MELTLTHASIALTLSVLGTVIHTSIRFGRFMEQFAELKQKVRIHDQLLGIPTGAEHHALKRKAAKHS